MKQLGIKYNQTIQLQRTITYTDWGADEKTLIKLYTYMEQPEKPTSKNLKPPTTKNSIFP